MNVPAEPRTPKAEAQANRDWGAEARRMLKVEMAARNWGYRDLSEHLSKLGLEIDPPTVNRRINRANFSAGFFLICLKVMGLRIDVLPETHPSRKRATSEKPLDALENLMGNWGKKSR